MPVSLCFFLFCFLQRLAFRAAAILYGLTRKRNYVHILPDLRGLGDVVFKLFRSGVLQTQNYCLQAFCNMAHNKDFAASIASDQEMMEGFIVGCMVHNNRCASGCSLPSAAANVAVVLLAGWLVNSV